MIYEVRTYDLYPGTVPDFEAAFAASLPEREKVSPLGAFWHTEIGPLNQVIHVWPYRDLEHRRQCREAAMATGKWPPATRPFTLQQQSEIMVPVPFLPEMKPGHYGNVYEMRTYTVRVGDMPRLLEVYAQGLEERLKLSPLLACWTCDVGPVTKFVRIWPYADLNERARIRAEATKLADWPPRDLEFLVAQENKILVPAPFSPVR
ncbi:MAG: NIPSNAP family protein [Chloroflexi bacterium]|nr:NIPSNAP family protein [Chloroflexota bacterium]